MRQWIAAVAAAALVLVGGMYVALHREHHGAHVYVAPRPPPSADAFARGGVPLSDPAIDRLLGEQLTELVVEGGRARDDRTRDVGALIAPLRVPAPFASRPKLAAAWRDFIATFGTAVLVAQRGEPTERAAIDLRETARAVSDELAAAGLGYFLEGRFKGGYPYVQAYRVDEVVFVIANDAPRRTLSLRRLDHLNSSYLLLGMHSEDLGDPLLLLDQIDEHVATVILPALARRYELAEPAWLDSEDGKALAARVTTAVRGELAASLGDDAAAAAKIGKLLGERADLVEQWRAVLARKGMMMVDVDSLFLPENLLRNLDGVVPHYQRERAQAIDDELGDLEAPRIAARLRDVVAATVRRHEAQHAFDAARDRELRYPQPLADLLGAAVDDDGEPVPVVRSARAELSAYLSQIANDPATPQLAVWNLARQLFTRDRWATGECYAAIVILEGLARHLGADLSGRAIVGGEIDRARFGRLGARIAAAPAPELRRAAGELWRELYGEPLTAIVDRTTVAATDTPAHR